MNRERAKELLPIIEAYSKGGTVQFRSDESREWSDVEEPEFRGHGVEYRIKPEPHDINWVAARLANKGQVRRRDWGNKTCYCTVHHYGIVFFSDGVRREELRLYPHDLLADDWEIYEPK